MATNIKEIRTYTCDLCGKEVESPADFQNSEYEYGGTPYVSLHIEGFYWNKALKEMCEDCRDSFYRLYRELEGKNRNKETT